jgi:CheY-like chemotaxis protein
MTTKHALVIDDNKNNIGVLIELLTLDGFNVTQVTDPAKTIPVLQALPRLTLIFLDLEMPGLDGYAVFDALRGNPKCENVPIVAHTVHLSEISRARAHGFHSFIGKPLDADTFPEHVSHILQGRPVWVTA